MIYAVECSFADPAGEAGWNDFYSLHKLPALISVSGFHTSQRFRALHGDCPRYLALHTIDGPDVLTGAEYRQEGGGHFGPWQQAITEWRRTLYDGPAKAPAVGVDEVLLSSRSGPEPLIRLGARPAAMRAIGLDRHPACRWLATLDRAALAAAGGTPGGVDVYAPLTARLTACDDAAATASR